MVSVDIEIIYLKVYSNDDFLGLSAISFAVIVSKKKR